jgi:hypothetical protein
MTERTFGYDPSTAGNISRLPADFLGVDQARLATSAAMVRGRDDLAKGLDTLLADFSAAGSLGLGMSVSGSDQNPESLRDVRRGAIIAHQLLKDCAPEPVLSSGDHFMDIVSLDETSEPTPTREMYLSVRSDLLWARCGSVDLAPYTDDERAQRDVKLSTTVDGILDSSGLGTSFDAAIGNLRGPGLEGEPTSLPEARYGAALVALGIAGL